MPKIAGRTGPAPNRLGTTPRAGGPAPRAGGSAAARRLLRRLVTTSARPAALLEAAGAHTAADRVDRARTGGDLTALLLPAAPDAWRRTRVKALRRGGRDQCVEAFHQGGWWGYERPLPDLLLGWVRAHPGRVLDVGANTGLYALLAASVPGTTVHAFEAFPPVAAMLRENLALNAVGRTVRVVEQAVTEQVGWVELHVPDPSGDSVETSCSVEEAFKGGGGTVVTVPCTTLDRVWDELGRPAVTAVKIDVEGAEHRVLAGAARLLAVARPVVFYEVLPGAALAALEAARDTARYVDVRLSRWEAVVGDAIRFHDLAWNHALVPGERLPAFLDIVRQAGLECTLLL